jgi:RNA polymerase sigma factor (sigma-70 family)
MIRVLLADDHTMFREMLRIALSRQPDIQVVGEAGDGRELIERASRTRPDVALVDYKMPFVRNFTALLEELRHEHPEVKVLVLSGFESSDIATRAANGGARGYLLKTTRLDTVTEAIRTVADEGIWIDPNLPRNTFDVFQRNTSVRNAQADGLEDLTRREREVLTCVAAGISNREIAKKLSISEQTVKTHLTRIFAKLQVTNRLAAALAFYGKDSIGSNPAA